MNPSSDLEFPKLQSMTTKSNAFNHQSQLPKEIISSYLSPDDSDIPIKGFQKLNFNEATQSNEQFNNSFNYQKQYYDPFLDTSYIYQTKFPRSNDYTSIKNISENFPHLEKVNDNNFNIDDVSSNARFFIMRSSNDDNIHKAIKYHIWTTTPNGKAALRQAWQYYEDNGLEPEIYLIFTVVSSNQFLGVAKMTSNVKDDESFRYWWEPCKWFGSLQIKWLFVKDIHHSKFEQMRQYIYLYRLITFRENSQIINLRDTTPILANIGKQILTIFKNFPNRPNIFEYFGYMDRREDFIRSQRDKDEEFNRYFIECCETYQKDPNHVFQYRRPNYGGQRKNPKRQNFNNYNNNYDNQGSNNYVNFQSNGGYNNQYSNTNSNSFYPSNYQNQNAFNPMANQFGANKKMYNNNPNYAYYGQKYQKREDLEPPQPFIDQFTLRSDLDKSGKKNKKKTKKDFNESQDDKGFGTVNFQGFESLKDSSS